ncbi:MAG TPA: MoaD/ThiS family protein [Anaerolineae bacterium]|nr:MoaD/ThiS family protein [Anaerolineae bacterium]
MEITVKLYGRLRNYRPDDAPGAPHHPFSLAVADDAVVATVAARLGIDMGFVAGTAVNGETAQFDTPLQKGDQVSLFPPTAGGDEADMHIFIAGIMQATRMDDQIESQNYRVQITEALQKQLPQVQITDPWALNPGSVNYDEERARHTFITNTIRAGDADLLIAYLPQPSMGTAMEMWEAFKGGAYIIAITPYKHHWSVRFTAQEIWPDLESFIGLLENGRFTQEILPKIRAYRNQVDGLSPDD